MNLQTNIACISKVFSFALEFSSRMLYSGDLKITVSNMCRPLRTECVAECSVNGSHCKILFLTYRVVSKSELILFF